MGLIKPIPGGSIPDLPNQFDVIKAKSFTGQNGGERIQKALNEPRPYHKIVLVEGGGVDDNDAWRLSAPLRIPSDTTLVLQGCYLKLNDGVSTSIIQNRDFNEGNKNIHIWGMGTVVLDCNGANQDKSLNNYRNIGLHFYNVNHFSIRGVRLKSTARWALVPEKCRYGLIDDIYFDNEGIVNQDGVHILGPSSDLVVSKIRGTLGDDACVCNARLNGQGNNVFQGYGTGGSIERITFNDVIVSGGPVSPHMGILRTSASPGTKVDGVSIANATGFRVSEAALRLGGNDNVDDDGMKNISATNIKAYQERNVGMSSIGGIKLLRPVRNLQVNNMQVVSNNARFFDNNGQKVNGMQLSNCSVETYTTNPEYIMMNFSDAEINDVQLNNIQLIERQASSTAVGMQFLNATVKNMQTNNLMFKGIKEGIRGDGTSTFNKVRFNEHVFDQVGTHVNMQNKTGIVVNRLAVDSGASSIPIAENYQVGDMVEYSNTSGTGSELFLLLPGYTWKKIA